MSGRSLTRSRRDAITVENTRLHGVKSVLLGQIVRIRIHRALASALVGGAREIVCTPEGRASELVFVFRVVSCGAAEGEAVAVGGALARGQIRDGDGIVVCGRSYARGDGQVAEWALERSRVDEVAYAKILVRRRALGKGNPVKPQQNLQVGPLTPARAAAR